MKIKNGMVAPDFTLPGSDGKMHTLSAYRGKRVLLYFYPKDDTPGCTVEACELRDTSDEFKNMNLVVLGVSADSVKSHEKFVKKFKLPFVLLSDEDKEVVSAYGAWGKKKLMGREYDGILRVSFLIGEDGKVLRVYENVKPKEHADEVLAHASLII